MPIFDSFLGRMMIICRDIYADKEVRLRSVYNTWKYNVEIDPYHLYYVDPHEIKYSMRHFDAPKRKLAGKVIDGEWDKNINKFTRLDGNEHFYVYQSFKAHFDNGVQWENTKFYDKFISKVRDGEVWWGCASREDVQDRCKSIDRLYEDIKNSGYLTQENLDNRKHNDPIDEYNRPEVYQKINKEIVVNVGRNGELIFYDGRNRLAISKLLDLDSVPVVILVRHEQWQQLRSAISAGELEQSDLPDHILSHPDIHDLIHPNHTP